MVPASVNLAEARCNLVDPRIGESSGVAAATWSDDVVFTHNDSGDAARFFAVDTRTCATRATYTVPGATNVDWEDMAPGVSADGTRVLWLADIGDNQARRSTVVVYEVAEPVAPGTTAAVPVRARWTLTYPDGARNAETLLTDPETGRPVVVTKDEENGRSRAYRIPTGGSGVLEPLASLDVRSLPRGSLVAPAWSLTGGATSPDRRQVVLRSYLAAWMWSAAPGEPLAAVLARPPAPVDVPLTRQPEAVSFTRDGQGLWLTSEGAATPIHLVTLGPPEATPAEPPVATPGSPPVRFPKSAGERSVLGSVLLATGAAVLGAALLTMFGRWKRRRRR